MSSTEPPRMRIRMTLEWTPPLGAQPPLPPVQHIEPQAYPPPPTNPAPRAYADDDISNISNTGDEGDEIYRIDAPPKGKHASFEACVDFIHDYTRQRGYDLVLKNSEKSRATNLIYRYTMKCSRHGVLDNTRRIADADRVRRRRGSKKTGCKQGILIVACDSKNPKNSMWEIRHQQGVYLDSPCPRQVLTRV
jgi:hypothetical protein